MKGISADGKHYVDYAHRCVHCNDPMPLPTSEGKHCPICGTREPTYAEVQKKVEATKAAKTTVCLNCGATGEKGSFCMECGEILDQ